LIAASGWGSMLTFIFYYSRNFLENTHKSAESKI
jgi:hypothetical protein